MHLRLGPWGSEPPPRMRTLWKSRAVPGFGTLRSYLCWFSLIGLAGVMWEACSKPKLKR